MKGKSIRNFFKKKRRKRKEVKAFQAEGTAYAKIGRLQGTMGCLQKGKLFVAPS